MYRAKTRMKRSLERKWNQRLNTIHLEKISKAKSRLDTLNPSIFKYGPKKSKKEQLQEGIISIIDRSFYRNRKRKSSFTRTYKWYNVP